MSAYGWKKVFKFTFVQTGKSKAFIISTIVICVLVLGLTLLVGIMPLLTSSDSTSVSQGDVLVTKKIYFVDNSGVTEAEDYRQSIEQLGLEFESRDAADLASLTETVNSSTECMLVTVSSENSNITIYGTRPEDGSVSQNEADGIVNMISEKFSVLRLVKMGLDENQVTSALAPITAFTSVAGEEAESMAVSVVKMIVPMVSALVLFILIFAYGQLIAQSIAQEKTSRVMELLLTSVRPLAVIIGKILAMGALSLMQFLLFIIAGVAGSVVSMPITANAGTAQTDGFNEITDAIGKVFSGVSPFAVIAVLVIFLIGFVFYSLIAGLVGASVSRMEDLNAAMQPYAIIGVIGFYLAYFPTTMSGIGEGPSTMAIISYYLPFSSPFALPSAILTGTLSMVEALVAILVLAAVTVLTAILVARVYEQIIFHNGNRLKISDIFGLAKNK